MICGVNLVYARIPPSQHTARPDHDGSVTTLDTNLPGCCVSLDLRPFNPNNVPNGYVIIHSAEGTLMTASDLQWLDDAVERFINSSRESNGYREAPFGSASNYGSNPKMRSAK